MGGVSKTQVVKYIRKGTQGAVLRGPQAWSDCATGYTFQAGGEGDKWQDVVLYNGNYYVCEVSHTKTASNYPTSTTAVNSNLWQLGDNIDLVATKILMATYALVENLGVTAIDMKDANGNILFQAKDGNVTCKTGTFDSITVSNAKVNGIFSQNTKVLTLSDAYMPGETITEFIDKYDIFEINGTSTQALPVSNSFAGRTITIYANANVTLTTTSNIIYGGGDLQSLSLSKEFIELKAFARGSTVDWVVLNKGFINPVYVYGAAPTTIAMGWTKRDGTTNRIYLFNGDKVAVSSSGNYTTLTMPKSYIASIDDLYISATTKSAPNTGALNVDPKVESVTISGANVVIKLVTAALWFDTTYYCNEFYIEIRNLRQFITL